MKRHHLCIFLSHDEDLVLNNILAIFNAEEGYFRPSLFCNQCPAEVEEEESSTETTLSPEETETTTTGLFKEEVKANTYLIANNFF